MPESSAGAIGQIVLTFTSFVPPDTGAIGFVQFTIDGEPISVVRPGHAEPRASRAPLKFADFQPLSATRTPTRAVHDDHHDRAPPTRPATTAP